MDRTSKLATETVPTLTSVVLSRPEPLMTNVPPIGTVVGLIELMLGAAAGVKDCELVATPIDVVTVIGPAVTRRGTSARIRFLEITVKTAGVPLKLTPVVEIDGVPAKFKPVISTNAPTAAVVGVREEIDGAFVRTTKVKLPSA